MAALTRNPNLTVDGVYSSGWTNATRPASNDPLVGVRPEWWWTGPNCAQGECAGIGADGKIGSLPLLNLASCTREQVLDYFTNGWALTEALFSALQGEEAFMRPPYHHLRHPMIFYFAHPACLYINKLRVARLLDEPINADFERIFETGVDEMSWDDMSKNEMTWPSVHEVNDYRRRAFHTVKSIILSHPDLDQHRRPINWDHPLWALFMAMEHERIHLETSSVLIREIPLSLLRRPDAWPALHPSAFASRDGLRHVPAAMVEAKGGDIRIGKAMDWPSYGWDNEYGTRRAFVRPFQISKHMVTNAEFLEFVRDGGYQEQRYWTEIGWRWRTFRNVKWPTFWIADGPAGVHSYKLRTLFEVVDFPHSWPVCVNFHEAKAFLAWRGAKDGKPYRLPTEAEHVWLRNPATRTNAPETATDPVMSHGSDGFAKQRVANANLAFGSESPVDWAAPDQFGIHDLTGNVWDWCEDDFHALDQFRVHPYYDDFSTPCFDGEHSMILGGSFASTGDEASIWARFHFRPHFFQHAGFHIVEPSADERESGAILLRGQGAGAKKYETGAILDQYLLLHYGNVDDALPQQLAATDAYAFPQRCADKLAEWARRLHVARSSAIDIGCGVGAAAFSLSRDFDRVEAIDISATFIEAAKRLQLDGAYGYRLAIEGDLASDRVARVPADCARGRVNFRRADACALPAEYVDFDAVLIANLLCRLASPRALLARLAGSRGLVRPGGVVLFASPFSWSEQFTTKSAWLGGYKKEESPVQSFDAMAELMQPDFKLVYRDNMPAVLREHARKYEYVISDVSVWQRTH